MNKLQEKVKLEKREIGIFISRDCIVTETYTGKTYKYRAYNYITGDTQYMGYKREAIEEDNYGVLLSKVAELSFYNISYPEDGEELIDYIFATVFRTFGFKIRMGQIELSKHMYRIMIEGSISLSDIAVGLGKTHAYIVASIVYHIDNQRNGHKIINQPMIISTSSKRLQNAIVKEYVPEISRMLLLSGIIEKPIAAIIRKGKSNYICDIRLKNYIDSLDPRKKNPREYGILRNILQGNQVDVEGVLGLRKYDRERINVMPKHCSSCPENKPCRYRRQLELVNQPRYSFQVTNHNYMIADLLKRSRGRKPLLPDYAVAIYDEAHKLPDAYMDMRTVELEKKEILDLIKRIKPKTKSRRSSKVMVQNCNEVIKLVNVFFNKMVLDKTQKTYEESNKYPVQDMLELKQYLYRLKNLLLHIILLVPEHKRREQIELEKLGDCIDMLMSDNSIVWVEEFIQPKHIVIRGIPQNINEMLGQDLFGKDNAVLLTSGTLSVNGDFSYIKKALCINAAQPVKEIHKSSPFDYYKNTLLYLSDDMPYPNQEDDLYINSMAEAIEILSNASYGHALVLFTSYEVMSKVYRLLKNKQLVYPLFILAKGNNTAIYDYKRSKNGILLACGSIWEGVDFTGDLLSHLIIVKLPFPTPDPITDYQKSQCGNERDFKDDILIPQMLTKLKQGHGRAIRTETDTAAISILDIRANGSYREIVRQALPNCRITYNIEDITTFIKDKKSPEYFLALDNQ
jgi:ATP-dependent DNA helicase DinG